MDRDTDREWNRFLTSLGFGNLNGPFDGGLFSGDDDLAGRIKIRGRHHTDRSGLLTDRLDHVRRKPQ